VFGLSRRVIGARSEVVLLLLLLLTLLLLSLPSFTDRERPIP